MTAGWRQRCALVVLITLVAWLAGAQGASAQRLAPELLKSGTKVRYAFRDVTAEASRATARILVDGDQVALATIVDADGYLLTKASQLGEEPVTVQLRNRQRYDAQIVGIAKDYDLAMLKIDAKELSAVEWSPSDRLAVGQWLATPGLGTAPVAVGVVSVGAREIPDERGVLGISIADADLGPQVTQVFPNSGAAKAGLKIGDIITRVAERTVANGASLAEQIRTFRPGDTLELLVVRENEERPTKVVLGTPSSSIVDRAAFQNQLGGELSNRRAGFPSALQHDTVLAPEDCGGVVVDLSGRAVGVNIARAGRTETYTIPAGKVLTLIADLKSGKLAPPEYVKTVSAEQ